MACVKQTKIKPNTTFIVIYIKDKGKGKIETNEMGRACGAYGGGYRGEQGVGGEA